MAFSTTAIRYGWAALTSLGILTGVTIYVANNTRHQIKPEDIVQLAIGTDERAMALQTANGVYPVARPSFVRTWTSNVYVTNGVTVYTNIVTNTIGWHVDRAMMVSLDITIKDLVPYYAELNEDGTPKTVTNGLGATNISWLTVTGLWATLKIGDGTNKFTREPAWSNLPYTDWHICYTSYWPTNGPYFPTTNSYTSSVNQVVNYGKSWTATGGVVWASLSNWSSAAGAVSNPATYGDYPWQIYPQDLEERYKVLDALQWASNSYMKIAEGGTVQLYYQAPEVPGLSPRWRGTKYYGDCAPGIISWTWDQIRTEVEGNFALSTTNSSEGPKSFSWLGWETVLMWVEQPPGSGNWGWVPIPGKVGSLTASEGKYEIGPFATDRPHSVKVQARSVAYMDGFTGDGAIGSEGEWVTIIDVTNSIAAWEYSASFGGNGMPEWCGDPGGYPGGASGTGNVNQVTYTTGYDDDPSHWYQNATEGTNTAFGTNSVFYYCTNQYW